MVVRATGAEFDTCSNPRVSGDLLDYRQRSKIVSLDSNFQLSERCSGGAKFGYRRGEITDGRDDLDFFSSKARLLVGRLDCNLVHRWDGLIEGRQLTFGTDDTRQWGGLFGIYRQIGEHARLGVGVTLGGIDDEYLGLQRERDAGWFINAISTF